MRYVPGWDTHGLPIELKVLQTHKKDERAALTPVTLREKAKAFALETVDKQRDQFMRYGLLGDWSDPYLTLKPEYEAAQVGVFGRMVLNGHIYRGLKPVNWSPSSQTALAEAELEYPEGHVSRSIYAAFKLEAASDALSGALPAGASASDVGVAVWTTTPWTIPANLAVAVNERLEYVLVEADGAAAAAAAEDEQARRCRGRPSTSWWRRGSRTPSRPSWASISARWRRSRGRTSRAAATCTRWRGARPRW